MKNPVRESMGYTMVDVIPAGTGFYELVAYETDDGTIFYDPPVAIVAWKVVTYKDGDPFIERLALETPADNCIARAILQPNGTVISPDIQSWENVDSWRDSVVKDYARKKVAVS